MSLDNQLVSIYDKALKEIKSTEINIRNQSLDYVSGITYTVLNYGDSKLSGKWLNTLNYLSEKISTMDNSDDVYGLLERITTEEEPKTEPEIESKSKRKPRRKKKSSSKNQREEYNLLRATAPKMLRSISHSYRRKSEDACRAQINYNIRRGKLDTKKIKGDVYLSERQFREVFGLKK